MRSSSEPEAAQAMLVLPGHPSTEAELLLAPYSRGAWLFRSGAYFAHWVGATLVTAIITFFDPHVLILPILIGGAWFFQAWRHRYRVARFRGSCPRCGNELAIPPDTYVSFPYRLDCMECHFEPEVELLSRHSLESGNPAVQSHSPA